MATIDERRTSLLAALAARAGVHYGWLVIGVTFCVVLAAAGIRALPGVVIKPLEAEFGWDRATISLAVALSLVAYGLAGPLSGRLIDQAGPRTIMLGALLLTALGALAMTVMSSLLELSLWWGLLVGLGTGSLAMVMGATVASRWFVEKRGLAIGIVGAGSSAGQLVFIPLMMGVTLMSGWRVAVGLGAVILLVVLLPLVFLVMRNQPAELGLTPYGSRPDTVVGAPLSGPLTSIVEALRTADFWLLAGSFFVCGFTSNGLIGTHLIPHAIEHGFTENTAAWILGLLGAMNVVGTTISGYLTDRFNARRLLAAYYAFRAASLVMLPSVTDVGGLTLFAIVFGLDYIATVPPTVALTADRFGRRSVGSIFGWIFLSHQVGAGAASFFGGVVRVWLGDYNVAFLAAGALGFVAAALSLRIATRPLPAPAPATA